MKTKRAHTLVGMVAVVAAFGLGFAVDAFAEEAPSAPTVQVPVTRAGSTHDIFDIFFLSPEQFVNVMSGLE